VFVNNSSLGLYARALMARDATRSRWRLGKWPAMALAALKTFWRAPMLHVRLNVDGKAIALKTPLVFVGNNRYPLDQLRLGAREQLDEGLLSMYVATTSTRWAMLKVLFRAAVGKLQHSRDIQTMYVREAWIETRHKQVHVAVDGELVRLHSPLHFRSWHGALQILAPPRS
jgi:diacylglycerol kinase family enzyme